jgi:hypothetical protein
MSLDSSKRSGGLKGFLRQTGAFLYEGSLIVRQQGFEYVKLGYFYGGKVAFSIATVSMVVLMPLLFEIAREGQVCMRYGLSFDRNSCVAYRLPLFLATYEHYT